MITNYTRFATKAELEQARERAAVVTQIRKGGIDRPPGIWGWLQSTLGLIDVSRVTEHRDTTDCAFWKS